MTPFVMVIFGATGDLTRKKLMPALFSLYKEKQLPEEFFIVGFARREYSSDDFTHTFSELSTDPQWEAFRSHVYYQQGIFEDEKGYLELINMLKQFDEKMGACITRVFYLATPPTNYEPILQHLDTTTLAEGCGQDSNRWTRIAIEKPFGRDVETAHKLDTRLCEIFEERQIFRVDHYLGKETVQNMLIFRFANNIFEPVWNNEFIDSVQINWLEKEGINTRGNFFDGVGILRDVVQNHMMELLAAVTMDMPKSFSKEDVRDARAKAIKAVHDIDPKDVAHAVVRGQYRGYREEPNVQQDSQTDTFVAIKFFVDTPRFANTPFYFRAGKAMKENSVTISIVFKQTCHLLFKDIGCPEEGNILTIRIQPNEGIIFRIIAKKPGSKMALKTTDMHFFYQEQFGTRGIDAYERLLLDILMGDQMLFTRSDELENSWKFITNILEGWQAYNPPLYTYEPGTDGPQEAGELMAKDGKKWI